MAINSAATNIYVMGNFPLTPMVEFSKLGWDGTSWSSNFQRSWEPSAMTGFAQYNKNSVFMGSNESYIFTLTSSDGGLKDEDCALTFWNDLTFGIPVDDGGTSKKNHYAKLRNCIHPKVIEVGFDIYVNVVIEYLPTSADTYTGFMTYKIDSAYTEFQDYPTDSSYHAYLIPDRRL